MDSQCFLLARSKTVVLQDAVQRGSKGKEVLSRYVVFEFDGESWQAKKLVQFKKWIKTEQQDLFGGELELFAKGEQSSFAKQKALGMGFFESKLFGSVSERTQEVLLAQKKVLQGTTITIPLPDSTEEVSSLKWTSLEVLQPYVVSDLSESFDVNLSELPFEDLSENADEDRYRTPEGLEAPFPIEAIHWSGTPKNRFNLLILPDGYQEDQMDEFVSDSDGMIANLMQHSPYKEYSEMINVIRVNIPSNESGVSCDDLEFSLRDNRYKTAFPIACLNALIGTTFNDRFVYQFNGELMKEDASRILYEDVNIIDHVYVLSRSEKYGGSAIFWANQTNHTPWNTAAHEIGHSLGGLADEYLVEGDLCLPHVWFAPNISTLKEDKEDIKWSGWLLDETPIPTPEESQYDEVIGLFQGAGMGCTEKAYRPKRICKMRNSQKPFCSVCMERMIHKVFKYANPIEGNFVRNGNTVDIQIASPEKMKTRWYIDGELMQETSSYESYKGLDPDKRHRVKVVIFDESAPVLKNRCDLGFAKKSTLSE